MENEFSKFLKYLESNRTEKLKSNDNFQKFLDLDTNIINTKQEKIVSNRKSKGFDVDKFESIMISLLKSEHEKLLNYERPYISITELCDCLRKSYFFRLKYKEEDVYIYPYLGLINKVGNEVHRYILNTYGYNEIEQNVISEKYKVKGRFDAVQDKQILIEIKTYDNEKFKIKNNYEDQHYLQSSIYSYILNTEHGYNIKTITLVYVLRNLKTIIPFDLEVNNKRAKRILDNSLLLQNHIKEHILIDPINSNEETCKYCPYKKICKIEQDKLKDKSVFLL